jgi:hypothetical protein
MWRQASRPSADQHSTNSVWDTVRDFSSGTDQYRPLT